MITGKIEINSSEWTEIAGGATWLQFSASGSGGTMLHFSEIADTPAVSATCNVFQSFVNGFDFDQSGFPEGQRIWAKSTAPTDTLCIVRDTNFYFQFIPANSDGLITADDLTFKVLGNG